MKWRNLKTNPPKNGAKILIRLVLDDFDEIKETMEYRQSDKIHRVGKNNQYKNEYLIDEEGTEWAYHYTSADIYYIPVDELKQIEIDK